jgi:hypothetical protein
MYRVLFPNGTETDYMLSVSEPMPRDEAMAHVRALAIQDMGAPSHERFDMRWRRRPDLLPHAHEEASYGITMGSAVSRPPPRPSRICRRPPSARGCAPCVWRLSMRTAPPSSG